MPQEIRTVTSTAPTPHHDDEKNFVQHADGYRLWKGPKLDFPSLGLGDTATPQLPTPSETADKVPLPNDTGDLSGDDSFDTDEEPYDSADGT